MKKICHHCQQPILNNRRLNAKYCCANCFKLAQKIKHQENHQPNVECSWCKRPCRKALTKIRRSVHKHGRIILFCNRICRYSAQKIGGIHEIQPEHYGTSTQVDYRELAFSTYAAKCARCNYDKNTLALDVHHKDKNRSNNNVDNLEILCCNCHMIYHRSHGSQS